MTGARSISIVLPAFNEEHRLPHSLDGLLPWLAARHGDDEVIVSDDGSTDGTARVARDRADADGRLRVLEAGINQGKGAALAAGFAASTHEFVMFLDADLPVPPETIEAMVDEALRTGADLVVGSRRSRDATIVSAQPLARRIGGDGFRLATHLLGYRLTSDPQCGVKLLRRAPIAPTVEACTTDRFAFDIELITRARAAGLTVVEMPVPWRHVEGSSLRPVRDAVITLRDLAVLRRRLRAEGVRLGR